jgi:3-oxoacyl-[acyl-carrier-protein] synthase II
MSSTATRLPIAVTGCGWELPAFARQPSLVQELSGTPLPQPLFEPEHQLGKKGLRYKERATLLALCAAKTALVNAGLLDEQMTPLDSADFGVIVASNSGNLDTVCKVADVIRSEHVNAASSMDLPNASSNIVASTLAIRFGLKALNLMICSGASASLDALILAANAIRQGRAQRMLVVTVETDGPALRSLLAGKRLNEDASSTSPILEGAAAVVLESPDAVQARGGHVAAALSDHVFVHADAPDQDALYQLFNAHPAKRQHVPAQSFIERRVGAPSPATDLSATMLQAYGSAALLQLIQACEQIDADARAGVTADQGLGAVIVGGGTWLDRRAGAIVVGQA